MNFPGLARTWSGGLCLSLCFLWLSIRPAVSAPAPPIANAFTNPPTVLTVEGTNVFIQRFRSNVWEGAYPNQVLAPKDRGRTGLRSRTSIRLSDLSVLRVGEFGLFEIEPLAEQNVEAEFRLFRGLLYLFNRDRPGKHRFVTPTATAATRGTEFNLEVDEATGRTVLTVLEGEAELSNPAGSLRLGSGEQGVALLGQQPVKTAVVNTTNVIQWCLYYPAVLDRAELELTVAEQTALANSLTAYQSGDLLQAVSSYPAARLPASDRERVYLAALLLSVGQVSQAQSLLNQLEPGAGAASGLRTRRLAQSLRQVIATVQQRPLEQPALDQFSERLATDDLAESYRWQAAFRLEDALHSARQAAATAPEFGFAWTRVAELEFGQGHIRRALEALDRSLTLTPRNAQALALKGFLLSAQNRIREAIPWFDQAIALDGGLGNAWLGRGLCHIRQGRAEEGRLDLQVAATAEPQRSLLRSYLGKAFSNAGDHRHAEKELRLAREIDANDPTPWLYSALLLQQGNRINEGVRDLHRSQDLNENRQLHRSRLLLDEDRAVRGANLARLYRDAGMPEVSVREAGRAVTADYTSYSSHLFLADSYNQLRDPKQVNLRYETAWFTEYLLANLLAPVGAGTLSQVVSDQEYSKLFERDRLGVVGLSEYFSHGAWNHGVAQYGTFRQSAYAVELSYRSDDGWRANNDLEQSAAVLHLKHQLTDRDSVYLQTSWYDTEGGDVAQYYRQEDANRSVRIRERQEPLLFAGYHREWSPASHTLLLAGRLDDDFQIRNQTNSTLFFNHGFGGPIGSVAPLNYNQRYEREQVLYSIELQQLWKAGQHTWTAGARYQAGEFETRNQQRDGRLFNGTPVAFPISESATTDLERRSLYLYDQWAVWPTLTLVGGVTYDWLEYPLNFAAAPISGIEEQDERFSGKAGFIWTPTRDTTLRGAYFQGLGGVNLDQSVRLEPSQVAGFNQAFTSVIPESAAGAVSASRFDVWAASVEQRFGAGTFFGVSGEIISSAADRETGVVDFSIPTGPTPPFSTGQTRERLDYRERSVAVTLNQLVGTEWAFGARYRLSHSHLETLFPWIPVTAGVAGGFARERDLESVLHQVHLSGLYNHASGFFAGASAIWNQQGNVGYTPDRPGDFFWQLNVEAGWRFLRRRVEVRVGLLNLTDQDYRLNPLNLTAELPRGREFFTSLRLNF